MVSTRSSKKTDSSQAVVAADEPNTPAKSPKRQSRKTRSSTEGLKSKNTGVGLSIDLSDGSAKKNKKIVFDDDHEILEEAAVQESTVEQNDQVQVEVNNKGDEKPMATTRESPVEEEEDDDDAVEEVKGSIAREEIIQQLEAEVKGASKSKKKKKKRKEKKDENVESKVEDDGDNNDDDDDNLDDDFFEKLESIKAEEQAKKELDSKKQIKGKHTTFVFQENDKAEILSTPKPVGHNIQVVVIADQQETISDDPFTSVPTSSLTKESLVLSRSDLNDGTDQGGKRKRNAPNRPDTSWKRSRKMNLLATPKSRFNRHGGRARPAANFVTKSKS